MKKHKLILGVLFAMIAVTSIASAASKDENFECQERKLPNGRPVIMCSSVIIYDKEPKVTESKEDYAGVRMRKEIRAF